MEEKQSSCHTPIHSKHCNVVPTARALVLNLQVSYVTVFQNLKIYVLMLIA